MKISVISFNIRCCDDINGNSIAERAPRLSSVTSHYDSDIIGFQEYRPAWETYIADFYNNKYDMFLKYRNKTVDIEASPILWRRDKFDCIKKGYFWLSDTPEIESRGWDEVYNCYRMCVYVILKHKLSRKILTVMNTHFGFGNKGQVDSANLIYDYSKKISENPTLVVGDFNMTPDSVGYAAMIKGSTNTSDKKMDTAKSSRKYRRLTELLVNSEGKPVSLSFKQIEDIVGFPLPDSAREHRAFWANTTSHSIALSWMSVGYKTVDVNLSSELVVFEK